MKWLRNLPEWVFWLLLSPIIALAAIWIAMLGGCAPLTERMEPQNATGDDLCVIVYDRVAWNMADEGNCKGKVRI